MVPVTINSVFCGAFVFLFYIKLALIMPPKKVKCVSHSGVEKPKCITLEIKNALPAKYLGNNNAV